MTLGAVAGVFGTLALVLGLLLLTVRVLKRVAPNAMGMSRGRIPMEVVERIALGARQGIAVVRIGETLLAVSTGEGGVRALAELGDAERAALEEQAADKGGAGRISDFRGALRAAVKQQVGLAALVATLGFTALAPVAARAQAVAGGTLVGRQKPVAAATSAPAASSPAGATAAPALTPAAARADTMITKLAPKLDLRVGDQSAGGLRLSGTVGVVVMMGLLTLLPTLVLMMTGFTRILIVLHFLKQAIGTQTAPPAQLIAGLALLLTGFVMAPTLAQVNSQALQPWMDGKMEQAEMMQTAAKPFREFMLRQTRDRDLQTFVELRGGEAPKSVDDVSLVVITSAFVTSELRTAFQIGFVLFLPFLVIDVVVSAVLMSMGMFMLPPAMISLPFKLLLFVLVDGWSLIVQSLIASFK